MGIGKRLRQAREAAGYTQNELAELVGITSSAITNYEKETSHPKENIMYKLIEVLGIDANFLFQDAVSLPKKFNNVTIAEFEIIKNYRQLDEEGKEAVNYTIDKELKRVKEMEELKKQVNENPNEEPYEILNDDYVKIRLIAYGGNNEDIIVKKDEIKRLIGDLKKDEINYENVGTTLPDGLEFKDEFKKK